MNEKWLPVKGYESFSKLNELQVRIIRRLKGDMKQREVANMFHVSRGLISHIQTNRSWNYIK